MGRKEAFSAMFEPMIFRAQENHPDKQCNPQIAICGPPGSGKTRFLDEVAALFGDEGKRKAALDLAGAKDDRRAILTSIFERLVPISITYDQGSAYNEHYDGNEERRVYGPSGLALRVLFRFVPAFSMLTL